MILVCWAPIIVIRYERVRRDEDVETMGHGGERDGQAQG